MRWPWKRLPDVPTGFERLDLLWSDMVPMAPGFLDVLPKNVEPIWGTQYGLLWVAASFRDCEAAQAALQRTLERTTLHRIRERQLKLLNRRHQERALNFLGALATEARTKHPKATAAQVLMVVRDEFRALLLELVAATDRQHDERDKHFESSTTTLETKT